MADGLRVLFVDDEPDVVELAESNLQRDPSDAEVFTATSGAEALAVLDDRRIDCVVSAHELPDVSGLELLLAVRERDPDLPFILFAGRGSEEVASEAISAGVTDSLPKAGPDQFRKLADRMENAVGQRRAEDALTDDRRKLEQLHETAFRLHDADHEDAVFEHATEAAEDVLDFDACGFFVHADGAFRPAPPENVPVAFQPLDSDEGIMGRTFRTGESALVADVTEDPDAAPRREDFRACISVPVGDHGVFQAVATEPGFFDERDLERAELLVSHVAGALDRIDYRADVETTNSQLETLLANTTANIYIKDLEGRYTLVNEAFAESLGMAREHIVGRTDEEVQDTEVAAEVRANDRLAIEEGRPIAVEESAGWSGEEEVYYSIKAPVFDDDGEPRGVCGVSSDITELKSHQRELERKSERLEEFASVVTHDLRNPLTVALGYAEILAEEDGQAAEELQVSLSRMEAIIEDLLTLAREGRQVGETEPVDLAAVAEEAWSTVDASGDRLIVECDLTVEADASRLLQVFENLFRNAVDHNATSPGSHARRDALDHDSTSTPSRAQGDAGTGEGAGEGVTIRLVETADGFAVVDDGEGLPDDGDHLGAGVSTRVEGMGVGLTIVDRIAEAHGWELSASNDDGARFEFRT